MSARFRTAVLGAGGSAVAVSVLLDRRDAVAAAARTWPPFVLVAGLLLIGTVANEDGVFAAAGALLDRLPGGDASLYLAAMGLVAVVTVFLNLDTAAAFLTPVMLYVAHQRRAGEARLLYGCVFMANAASLLLPGSNLTNLLVVAGGPLRAAVFAGRMLAPWAAAVVVTAAVVGVAFRSGDRRASPEDPRLPRLGTRRPEGLTLLAIGLAAAFILVFPDAALPVAAVGAGLLAVRVGQRRLRLGDAAEAVDAATIAGLFGVATALGTLARAWPYPMAAMRSAGAVTSAAVAAIASVAVNNLPAAVLLGS